MTREEHIYQLEQYLKGHSICMCPSSSLYWKEHYEEIIKVLEQEPTTKNDLTVDCISREQAKIAIRDKFKDLPSRVEINTILNELPSVTPQLSVPEITALAEWTTKLTEANKSAYSQGYADGMKAQAEPKTGHCKDCKWWKDSDGVYRRGVGAESQCPINRREVFEGNGYCYIFEPQESEET